MISRSTLSHTDNGVAPHPWLPVVAGLIYSVSFQKYVTRSALSPAAGLQGMLETSCALIAVILVLLVARPAKGQVRLHPAFVWLMTYDVLALASSWRSYSPSLSVVKAILFGALLVLALLAGELRCAHRFFSGVYFGYVLTLVAGYALALLRPGSFPLMQVDEYSGRTQLTLWSTHPNQVAETCGLLFLLGILLPIGARWYTQLLLLGTNVFAGEKTSTIALFVIAPLLILSYKDNLRRWGTLIAVGCCLGVALLVFADLGTLGHSAVSLVDHSATSVYGSQVGNEMGHFDGRTDVWKRALSFTDQCLLLGFGFDGARELLLAGVDWGGHAHNGVLQAMLTAGVPGALTLVLGLVYAFFGSLTRAWSWDLRVTAVAIYLVLLSVTSPIFDSCVYLNEVAVVVVLYTGLNARRERPELSFVQPAPAVLIGL